MRKKLSILLIVVLLFSVALPTRATQPVPISPQYTYIRTFARDLQINTATGVADCYGKITATANNPVKVVCKLEVYWGGEWTTIKTWTATGNAFAVVSETYNAVAGFNYRIHVTGYVYDSSGNRLEVTDGITEFYYPKN